jgi:hypothetical protein
MIRKIYILSFIVTFFISTTGLPLTLHICKMMEMEKMNECSICNSSKDKIQMPCCSEEMQTERNAITDSKAPCCELTIVDKKLSDKFFFSQNNSKEEFRLLTVLIENGNFNQNSFSLYTSNKFVNGSPPGLLTNHRYLNLSVLLI